MTIEKAIGILHSHIEWCDPVKEVDTYDALNLGIEALKRCKEARAKVYFTTRTPLPGETKE